MSIGLKVIVGILAVIGLVLVGTMILGLVHWIVIGAVVCGLGYLVVKLAFRPSRPALPGDDDLHRRLKQLENDAKAHSVRRR